MCSALEELRQEGVLVKHRGNVRLEYRGLDHWNLCKVHDKSRTDDYCRGAVCFLGELKK